MNSFPFLFAIWMVCWFEWSSASPCDSAKSCHDCLTQGNSTCRWCIDSMSCASKAESYCKNWITSDKYCALGCSSYWTCDECLAHSDKCNWCLDTQKCYSTIQGGCNNVINSKNYCGI